MKYTRKRVVSAYINRAKAWIPPINLVTPEIEHENISFKAQKFPVTENIDPNDELLTKT